MDSIFGIGLPELFFIAIIALIVLGPERLPGAIRELAKFLKTVRALGNELTSQFSEELSFLDEMNPRRIIEEATRPDPPAKDATKANTAKNAVSKEAKPKTTVSKPATSTAARTDKGTPATAKADKASTPSANAKSGKASGAQDAEKKTENAPQPESNASASTAAAPVSNAAPDSPHVEAETENQIAPPELRHSIEQGASRNGEKPQPPIAPSAASKAAASPSAHLDDSASVAAPPKGKSAAKVESIAAESSDSSASNGSGNKHSVNSATQPHAVEPKNNSTNNVVSPEVVQESASVDATAAENQA